MIPGNPIDVTLLLVKLAQESSNEDGVIVISDAEASFFQIIFTGNSSQLIDQSPVTAVNAPMAIKPPGGTIQAPVMSRRLGPVDGNVAAVKPPIRCCNQNGVGMVAAASALPTPLPPLRR